MSKSSFPESPMPTLRIALVALAALLPTAAAAAAPIKSVHDSLRIPEGMDVEQALAAVEDLTVVFDHYEPAVPWVPGVQLELDKRVVSPIDPTIMGLPVQGTAFGRVIDEWAQVTASTEPLVCAPGLNGLRIDLSFAGSSHNVERRIERIEIRACPRAGADGVLYIDATGDLYEGPLPRDPALNALNENLGAKAIQTAFIKQVPAVFAAVERTWAAAPMDTGLVVDSEAPAP